MGMNIIELVGVSKKMDCFYERFWYTKEGTYSSGPCPEFYYKDVEHECKDTYPVYCKLLKVRDDGFKIWMFSLAEPDKYSTFTEAFNSAAFFIERCGSYMVDHDNYINYEFYRSLISDFVSGDAHEHRIGSGSADEEHRHISLRLRHRIEFYDDSDVIQYGTCIDDIKDLKIKDKAFNEFDIANTLEAVLDSRLKKIADAKRRKMSAEERLIETGSILLDWIAPFNGTLPENGRITRKRLTAFGKSVVQFEYYGINVQYNVKKGFVSISYKGINKGYPANAESSDAMSKLIAALFEVARLV